VGVGRGEFKSLFEPTYSATDYLWWFGGINHSNGCYVLAYMNKLSVYTGQCHCKAIQFEISAKVSELTTCDCSICKMKNAVMLKVPQSSVRLIKGAEYLQLYQFHTHVAKHYFCKRCGIYPFHRKRVTPDFYGINVFCLQDFDITGYPLRATDGAGMN